MRPAVKLSAIDQEHLQELYDASGTPRDQLPYTPAYDSLCEGFQDRTFKNAHKEQVYAALLKYTRSGTNIGQSPQDNTLNPDQKKQLKGVLSRHARGGKVLPYSDEVDAARHEFNKNAGLSLDEGQFWQAIIAMQGARRRPPVRVAKQAVTKAGDSDEDDDE